MTTLPELKAGVYRHYKGPLYQVLGYAHDANTDGRMVVVYMGLQLDDAHTGPRLSVRTVEDFFDVVGRTLRFTYLGPDWEGDQ